MNTKEHMIIIKGNVKTSEVRACRYNSDTETWEVEFTAGKVYSYSYSNVVHLQNPEQLNPSLYRIRRGGKELYAVREIFVFHGTDHNYWHLCFENGEERNYLEKELEIEESVLKDSQAKAVLAYLKQLSQLSGIRNSDTGEKLLPKRYEAIRFVDKSLALSRYLGTAEEERQKTEEFVPIFPFGCNNSQYKAVKRAMEHQLSVIQGSPGTGKTQTILNIIANILLQGKTVQIVSNNNAAIENVFEKLASPKYQLDFIAAALGSSENKRAFIENQSSLYPDFSQWRLKDENAVTLDSIKEKSLELKSMFDMQERKAELEKELSELELEMRHFEQYGKERKAAIPQISIKKRIKSSDVMELWQQCQDSAEQNRKISFFFKIRAFLQAGIANRHFYKKTLSEILLFFEKTFYECRCSEIRDELAAIDTDLKSQNPNLMDMMCGESMQLLRDRLARKYGERTGRRCFKEEDLWKEPQEVLREYPVILSTTFSSRSSLGNETVYDYLIMDEASQVDIATGALALSCAKNAVIVGDTKQLPNVVTRSVKERADELFSHFQLEDGYQYSKSFLQSVLDVVKGVEQTLLREHYRCHPKIINFCNQKFYHGELAIMTKDQGEQNVLAAVRSVKENHARGRYSQRQIDIIRQEIIPEYVTDKSQTGIIAPYRDQVKALEQEFKDIDTATVHKFQGREKDTIIISTVDDEISDFADDPYLLNVAVSRAKKRLILVMSGNDQPPERNISELAAYIAYNNCQVIDSRVYSIFDYLYSQYTEARREYLKKHKRISEYDSENLMYGLITEVLEENPDLPLKAVCHVPLNMLIRDDSLLSEEEKRYVKNPASHMDFLIVNRITKMPALAIEVDGTAFHKEGSAQAVRDERKNVIFKKAGIPLARFASNGSGERKILTEKLRGQ